MYIAMYHYTRDRAHSRYPAIKGLDAEGMRRQFLAACAAKPERHGALSYEQRSGANRSMNRIGG